MMKKAWSYFLIVWLLIFSLSVPAAVHAAELDVLTPEEQEIYHLLKQYHIYAGRLQPGTTEEMLRSLGDPYTQYFTKDEFEDYLTAIDGTYTGVGIVVEEKDGSVMVIKPIAGSPAYQAGVQSGDKIIAVDGKSVVGLSMEEVTARIKGEEGTKVQLTVLRGDQVLTFQLVRAEVHLPLVEDEILDGQIGYIVIHSFGEDTYPSLRAALDRLKEKNIRKIILDLRGNPGGRLESVMDTASLFIGKGPVVWVKNSQGRLKSYVLDHEPLWQGEKAIVLVDQYSASASEILAAALKEYGKGILVGTTTFGKGTVQTMIPLSSGNVLKLTTEEYFSPTLGKINGVGVQPHIRIDRPEEQMAVALQLAKGIDKIVLSPDGRFYLNDLPVSQYRDMAVYQGKWYVSLYRLQLMLGGHLGWNGETKTASYSLNGRSISFTLGKDDVRMIEGRIYVPVERLKDLGIVKREPKGNWIIVRPDPSRK